MEEPWPPDDILGLGAPGAVGPFSQEVEELDCLAEVHEYLEVDVKADDYSCSPGWAR